MKIVKTLKKLNDGEKVKIAALGDSLTYGWMTEYGFLDYLKTMLNEKFPDSEITILNRGIPGDTAKDGLRRVENDIIRTQPDLVMVQFALNDAYTGFTPEDFQKNIDEIILRLKDKTASEIILLTSVALLNPLENKFAYKFYEKIIESGKRFTLPVAAVHEYWSKKITSGITHSSLTQSDGIHPTEKGYKLMAEAVFELF